MKKLMGILFMVWSANTMAHSYVGVTVDFVNTIAPIYPRIPYPYPPVYVDPRLHDVYYYQRIRDAQIEYENYRYRQCLELNRFGNYYPCR